MAGRSRSEGRSAAAIVMRLRALIALALLAVTFSLLSPGVPHRGQSLDPRQARGDQRDPRHRDDVRDPERRHRPLRRVDCRPVRDGRRGPAQPGTRAAGPRRRGLPPHLVRRGDRARRRHGGRRAQRLAGRAPRRRAVHRDARLAVRRAGCRAAHLGRRHLPEPRRIGRAGQHGLHPARHRRACSGCPSPSG